MFHKITISVIAAIEVLTMLPLLFWGLYSLINSASIKDISTSQIMLIMLMGVGYASSVLLGAYKATQNIHRPGRAYLILLIPVTIAGLGYYFRNVI
jgi:drug/metabolite transporter (DMT)-like permease